MSTVGVIGTGYVGATTAACMAHLGHDVVGADVDSQRVSRLNRGESPIHEAQLADLLGEGVRAGRLRFVDDSGEAARGAEFVFLCVQTPQGDGGTADLSYLEAAARDIAPVLEPRTIVINKSTAPVGSTRRLAQVLEEEGAALHELYVASNPEFLREGTAVHDFLHPDRIVIGCDDPDAAVRIAGLYEQVQAPILTTSPASAELIKYASNSYLAMRVSYVNAIANLCESLDADVRDVSLGMGYDRRIGSDFLHPGPGWGGSCLPKDTAALLHTADKTGYDFTLLRSTIETNDRQRTLVVEKIATAAGGSLEGATVAVWGLAYKANTDDLRESPGLDVVRRMQARGANVVAYDPVAGAAAAALAPEMRVAPDPYEACEGADVLALLTEWDEFRWLDFDRVRVAMARPSVVDARNLLDPAAMRHRGFAYWCLGR